MPLPQIWFNGPTCKRSQFLGGKHFHCKRPSVGVFRSICDISNKSTGKSTFTVQNSTGFEYSIIVCNFPLHFFFKRHSGKISPQRVHLPSGPLGVFSVAPSCGVPPRLPVIGPQTLRRLGYLNVSYRFIAPFHPAKNQGGWLEMRVMG